MSTSRHPVALRLEEHVGGTTRLLATVMGLPLVDGIFPALILAGALDSPTGILEVGLLVFGGSATVAVILAEMEATPREGALDVLLVGAVIVPVAAMEAALAPTIRSVLDLHTFERFAALVIAAIAAKTASATVGEYLPSPGVIVGFGLLASMEPAGATLAFRADPGLVVRAGLAALVGTAFGTTVALLAPTLRERVDVDRFRFGSAVALGLLPLSILGVPVGGAPLAVIGVTALFALEPSEESGATVDPERVSETAVTDGGRDHDARPVPGTEQHSGASLETTTDGARTGDDDAHDDAAERAPWL